MLRKSRIKDVTLNLIQGLRRSGSKNRSHSFMRFRVKPGMTIGVFLLLLALPVIAVDEINKKLELKENYSHLLSFDEKIIRYKTGVEDAFDVEILPGIYNKRHEMLVKPLKPVSTNLIVWTKKRVYNFDIRVKIINKGYEGFDCFEVDLPPGLE